MSDLYELQVHEVPVVLQPTHLVLLVAFSAAAVIWGALVIFAGQGFEAEEFLLLVGLYGIISAIFIFSRTKGDHLRFFDIPVFLTILCFVSFGLAPLECFLDHRLLDRNFHGDYGLLLRALAYFMLGIAAFWLGSNLIDARRARRQPQQSSLDKSRDTLREGWILGWAVALYVFTSVTKLYLLTHHLYSYTGSLDAYYENLASMQVLNSITSLGTFALVIVSIERYCHPMGQARKLLFVSLFVSECLWGLISGMRGLVLQNFIVVALVASLIQRRFRKDWIVTPLIVAILMGPAFGQYRNLMRGKGMQVASMSDAARVGRDAVSEAAQNTSSPGEWIENGTRSVLTRLDLLQSVGLVISLGPKSELLRGEERLWMIPFYPFIPRFIWQSKPVLDKGARFSVALGSQRTTSTAITYPGDLYLTFGLPGLLVGMFLLGIGVQWLTNGVSGALDKRRLFIYAAVFLTATNMEIDSFSYWSSLIKSFAILSAIAFGVYGPRHRPSMVSTPGKKALARS